MRRSFVLCVVVLGLLLAACAPASAPAPTAIPQTADKSSQSTAAPQPTQPAAIAQEPDKPAATPDMEKVLNPQPADHKLGPDGAPVTIIEWGDFQ